jgi:hypothetical protein
MIYFVERSDGRVKIGYTRSLYKIGLGLHGGRLVALIRGSTADAGRIKKEFAGIPSQDGWLLLTSSVFNFMKEHSIENSDNFEDRRIWAQIQLEQDVERDVQQHGSHNCMVRSDGGQNDARFNPHFAKTLDEKSE